MSESVLLGKVRSDAGTDADGEKIYLEKHSWDCGWYWGFGYVGNYRLHTHFDSQFLKDAKSVDEIFESTELSDKQWWVLRDLFVQAYALKKAAEVYRYGGHQTSVSGVTDFIEDDEMVKRLNNDLEAVLDMIWRIVSGEGVC